MQWILENNRLLYDKYEIYFTVELDRTPFVFKVRHKWKGHSDYNVTHPIEKSERFGDVDFDIGIGGHTHNGTLIRPFHYRNRLVYSVLIGTYLMDDRYSVQLGYNNTGGKYNTGCGALMLWPNGYIQGWEILEMAIDYLKFERKKK